MATLRKDINDAAGALRVLARKIAKIQKQIVKLDKAKPAKKAVAKKAAPKRKVAKKAAPKRKVAKKTAAKRKVTRKAAPKRKVAKKAAPKRKVAKKAAPKRKVAKKTAAKRKVVRKAAPKKARAKKAPARKAGGKKPVTAVATITAIITRSRGGVDVATLMAQTGYDKKKVANLVFKLKNQKKIKSVKKGVYTKA